MRERERRAGGTLRDMKDWESETNRDIEGKEATKKWRKIEREKKKKTRQSPRRKEEKKTGQKQ